MQTNINLFASFLDLIYRWWAIQIIQITIH
jgi:hypothetical protein